MQTRKLGRNGPAVPALGLGCMGLTGIYGEPNEAESIATIHRAIDLGVNLIVTSDAYAAGANEELVGRAIKGKRSAVLLATKFGNVGLSGFKLPEGLSAGHPGYVPQACDASLKRLGVEVIDIYGLHRVDPKVPIEDTVGAMKKLVDQGKVRYLALSEAGAQTIRRAHKVHPLVALETEYSLWSRDVEKDILPACRELGIGYMAYSPLGRGRTAAGIIRDSIPTTSSTTSSCCNRSNRSLERTRPRPRRSRSHGSSLKARTSCPFRARNGAATSNRMLWQPRSP